MDINRFTAELVSRLRNAGADEAAANRHARAFVGSLPEREAAAIAAHADDEGVMRQIADRIMVRINKEAESRAQEAPPAPPADDDGFDDDDDMIAAMLADPGDGDVEGEQPPQPPQPQPPQMRENPRPPQARQPERDPRQVQPRQAAPQTPTPTPQARDGERQPPRGQSGAQRPPQKQPNGGASRPAPRKNPEERKTPRRRRPIYKPDPNADYRKFYIIFGCTAPIWGLAVLFLALLFIFAYAALAAAIVILIAGLFAGVAVGVVLAVVGIIYGITQLFELQPVGMYEIGLGIMIGGFVMFGGILAYNGAVRLLPFLIRELSVLLSFTIHKCVELYYYVKGRCADL